MAKKMRGASLAKTTKSTPVSKACGSMLPGSTSMSKR